ncbi:MAG: V-type ATPase subunit [Candidatus Geothermarchaeales archaeon]
MKSPRLIYLVTRAHSLRTHLVRPEEINTMVKARNLVEVVDVLLKGKYAAEVSKIPVKEIDASTLERIFLKKLVERFHFVVEIAPSRVQDFLKEYARRFEIENIRRIIRAKHAGEAVEEASLIPLAREYTLVNSPPLLKARDVQEVVELLRETIYAPLTEKLELYKRYGATLILEACLDDIYFERLWETVDKLPDGKEVKHLVGAEMDLKNLIIALGLKMRGVEPSLIEELLISNWYKLRVSTLRSVARARMEDAIDVLSHTTYAKLAREAQSLYEKALFSDVERLFLRQSYNNALAALRHHPLKIVYVLAYLLLCEQEAKNLTTIAVGKELKLGEEKIQGNIII